MRAIRKGNDINILWDIMHEVEGQSVPYDLTGKDVTLYLGTPYGKEKAEGYKTEGNTVIWSYRGKDQKTVGVFSLILVINEGEPFMQTVDECKVFQIVEYSCQAGGTDNEGIKTETISLSTHIDIAAIIPDTVLDPNSLNVVTNAAICEGIEGLRTYLNQQIADLEAKTGQDFSAFKGEIERIIAEFIASVNSDINTLSDTMIAFKGEVNGILAEYAKNNAEIMESFRAEFEQLESSLVSRVEHELSKIADKANTTGYYPQLHVGLSDNLPDRGDVTEGLIGFRESAGADNSIEDGTANVQELLGESLVWNQLRKTQDVSNSGITFTWEGNVVTASGVATLSYAAMCPLIPIQAGHVVLVMVDCIENPNAINFGIELMNFGVANAIYITPTNKSGYGINKAAQTYNNGFCFVGFGGIGVDLTGIKLKATVHDLTQMFGAGNEPSTIEEFNAIKNQLVGVDFNAYNAGEVLGVNIKGIKSVNDNAWDEEWRKGSYDNQGNYISTDPFVTSKNPVKVLPNKKYHFSHKQGEAVFVACWYDNNMKFISRVYLVNNGTTISPNGACYMNFRMQEAYGLTYNHDICIRLAHSGYKIDYVPHEESESSFDLTKYFPNGMHGIGDVRDSVTPKKATQRIGIRDYIEGDENDTLVMTDGKKTIYELAEPIETEIDPQLNMNYKVWDFGTEELLTDSKSAPVLARTIYGFNATDTIRGNKAKNEEQDVRLQTLEGEVVRIGDYQPDLSVGVADQLAGQDEPTPSEINFRRSGGGAILDGNARIEAIKGNSVVWNQQLEHRSQQGFGCTMTWDGDIVTINGTSERSYVGFISKGIPCVLNEKILLIAEQVANPNNLSFSVGLFNAAQGRATLGGGKTFSATIVNCISTVESDFGIDNFGGVGTDLTGIRLKVRVINLTKMFQAGNEPTTIEEYNARKPIVADEYAYNEGEVIHMDVQSLESVGVNQWGGELETGKIQSGEDVSAEAMARSIGYINIIPNTAYYATCKYLFYPYFYDEDKNYIGTPNNVKTFTTPSNARYLRFFLYNSNGTAELDTQVCINLSDASINGKYFPYVKRMQSLDIIRKYFPDGMKSAGTAHDEIRYNKASGKWEYSKGKIKSVDMGTLNWVLTSKMYFRAILPSDSIIPTDTNYNGFLCAKYERVDFNLIYHQNVTTPCFGVPANNGVIGVYDSAYTDAASFKAAMQGVILYYESNDWEWVELDKEDQLRNFDYQVWNCGTEQAIANVPSTPLKADIVYGFNAYGTIKQLKEQMATLMTQMAQMQTAMASVISNKE